MLINCPECQKEISSDAKKCPNCGAKNAKRNEYRECSKCKKAVHMSQRHCECGEKNPAYINPKALKIGCAVFILIAIIFGAVESCSRTPDEKRQNELKKNFSSWNGSHNQFVEEIKSRLNNPSSFEHVETSYKDFGKNLQINMKFRAKNKFNATITTTAIGIVDAKTGKVLKASIKN